MALGPPLTIRVERPKTALSETMNEMSSWLHEHGFQPVECKNCHDRNAGHRFRRPIPERG